MYSGQHKMLGLRISMQGDEYSKNLHREFIAAYYADPNRSEV
jgi:hypothetical protein